MGNVEKIKLSKPSFTKKRVCAYARVSTASEQLLHSLSAQVSYYNDMIQKNPDWEFAGIYADEGITGTSIDARKEFQRMLADADAGKIDIVLTKSISRFARNRIDLLKTVRHLKSIGVEVRFEREQISTFSSEGEMVLTLLASFAEEESKSISENITWAIRKGYQEGKEHIKSRSFGYRWDGEERVIVPEEAMIVQQIFETYATGRWSPNAIARDLEAKGIRGVTGKVMNGASIRGMLTNESYIGDSMLQKAFVDKDGIKKRNYGELPRYYVEDTHEAIISRELFDQVQEVMRARGKQATKQEPQFTCFTGKVVCGYCGYKVSRRNIVHRPKERSVSITKRWVCNRREKTASRECNLRPIDEDELYRAAIMAVGDMAEFSRKVGQVILFDERIEFRMKRGKTVTVKREDLKPLFTGQVICGYCGKHVNRYAMGNIYGKENPNYFWKCRTRATYGSDSCKSGNIQDWELRKAAVEVLGLKKMDEERCRRDIRKIVLYRNRIEFTLTGGEVRVWERK
ncbi:recombinase family protein [Eubacterium pyruvativorans]|uniref:recombinase family protein n=1 Tax=Eubacterium pyruvativorans TaxID=155865 RepID=UPI00156860FF|nr:recombinase family protein [Eubacterium pyruvativorans]